MGSHWRLFVLAGGLLSLAAFAFPGNVPSSQPLTQKVAVELSADGTNVRSSRVIPTTSFTLNLSLDGAGQVRVDPGARSCTKTCSLSMSRNKTVKLTAKANDSNSFLGFAGKCKVVGNTCTFNMTSNMSVSARFTSRVVPTVTPVSADAIYLPDAGGNQTRYVTVAAADFETGNKNVGAGWWVNAWSKTTKPLWDNERMKVDPKNAISGSYIQRFRVDNKGTGAAQLTMPISGLALGKVYRATAYLRAEKPIRVNLFMRHDDFPFEFFASKTVDVTTAWQKYEIQGAFLYTGPGSLRIDPQTLGVNVYLDSVSVDEVQANQFAPVSTAAVPDTLFGTHLNMLGQHNNWPGPHIHLIRLHDSGTTWNLLEPEKGQWVFTNPRNRMDFMVDRIKGLDPTAQIIYTMGQTPRWASSSPDLPAIYGTGASAPAKNMNDWRNYVRTIAKRYSGKIRYWELGNEADLHLLFSGTPAQMVEMARIAREELKAVDPNNMVMSPSLTSNGLNFIESFFANGGGQYVDIISTHYYWELEPEKAAVGLSNLRNIMKSYGLNNKPLWNTEGTLHCNTHIDNCSGFNPNDSERRGGFTRGLLMMVQQGVQGFAQYHNENGLVKSDFKTPTEMGKAYIEAYAWLRGAQMIDGIAADNQSVFAFRIKKNGKDTWVVWALRDGRHVVIPAAWGMKKTRTIAGKDGAVPSNRELTVGIEPILLTP